MSSLEFDLVDAVVRQMLNAMRNAADVVAFVAKPLDAPNASDLTRRVGQFNSYCRALL